MSIYAFFIETEHCLSGNQKTMLFLAKQLSQNDENKVYYLNNLHEADMCFLKGSGVNAEDVNTFDYTKLENANIFVPSNYLFFLLTRLEGKIEDANICLFSYDEGSLNRLFNQNCKKAKITSFLALIKREHATVFPNRLAYYQTCLKYGIFIEKYQPLCLPVNKGIQIKQSPILENTVNLAYIADINSIDAKVIAALCNNLRKLDLDDKKINIHLIGNGGGAWQVDLSKFAPKIRFIYPGELTDEKLNEYLKKNVDLVVASRENAIEAVSFGVPTVIPIYSKTHGDNCYVWFYDVSNYTYRWERDELLLLNYKSYGIEDIINSLYYENAYVEYSQRCYDSFLENNALENATERFLVNMQDCKLTYSECMQDRFILQQLIAYKEASGKDGISQYKDFFEKRDIKVNRSEIIKKSIKKVIYPLYAQKKRVKFLNVQSGYRKKVQSIARLFEKNRQIKVAFIVVFRSVFPTRPIFEKMCADPCFDPFIIVAPNVSRSMKYQRDTYNDAYEVLREQYGDRVIGGYDIDKDSYLELFDEYSMIFFCNPYKHLVHPYHEVEYFLDKPVLPVYASYGFAALKFWEEVVGTDFYNYMWMCTIETESNLEYLKKIERIKGRNGVVTGYVKMDKLALVQPSPRRRKRILICPHHTVWGWKDLNISNFLQYADLFIRLPKLFPEIDFVFRPHPLLLANLKTHRIWTQAQIDEYFDRLLDNPNMEYDTSGDYFQQFADSDAMIHDCGSFIGEYLYTEKPCCYMMKSKKDTYDGLVPLGQQCMDQYYHAFTEEDIIKFIQEVVVNGNDPMKERRVAFVNNELKVNYPHAADAVIDRIKKELKIK